MDIGGFYSPGSLLSIMEAEISYSGVIMICALCVPGFIIHGAPGPIGAGDNPVDSAVSNGT